jgi:hypothetical protein
MNTEFHNGFLINYAPARANWRQVVTNLVRLIAGFILLASVSMQSYAPPVTHARDHYFSVFETAPSIDGLLMTDLTDEELEDYTAGYRELAKDAISERKKLDLDIAIYQYEAQSAIETLQEREKCRAGKKKYCRDLLTHVATGVR